MHSVGVGSVCRDAVAVFEPQTEQVGGDPRHRVVEFAVGASAIFEDDGYTVGVLGCRAPKHSVDSVGAWIQLMRLRL